MLHTFIRVVQPALEIRIPIFDRRRLDVRVGAQQADHAIQFISLVDVIDAT